MKVLWQQHGKEEATGEPEATMRALYPKLFTLGNNFEEKNSFKGGGGGGGELNILTLGAGLGASHDISS